MTIPLCGTAGLQGLIGRFGGGDGYGIANNEYNDSNEFSVFFCGGMPGGIKNFCKNLLPGRCVRDPASAFGDCVSADGNIIISVG